MYKVFDYLPVFLFYWDKENRFICFKSADKAGIILNVIFETTLMKQAISIAS